MITATLARQHGIKGPVVVVQVVNATHDTERHGSSALHLPTMIVCARQHGIP